MGAAACCGAHRAEWPSEDRPVGPRPIGGVRIHPNLFHSAFDAGDVAGWQVVQANGQIQLLPARPAADLKVDAVVTVVRKALADAGVRGVRVTGTIVDTIPRTELGKAPLIRRA